MIIGIDLSAAVINQAGTSVYISRLVENLKREVTHDRFRIFSVNQSRDMSAKKTLQTRADTFYRDLIWMHGILPLKALQSGVDVLHMPAGVAPFLSTTPIILTILDTTIFHMSGSFPLWQKNYFRVFSHRSAKHAKRIITISENSKLDIIQQFNVPAEKVDVTYLAAGPEFTLLPTYAKSTIQELYNLGTKFILTVGTIEPRKNLSRLIEAFGKLKKKGVPHQLVHVGPKGWLQEDLAQRIEQLGLNNSIRFLGMIPIDHLIAVYNLANLLVYPSLYEGFGLPVLEAMACGCPVVTSNTSSLPEVAGDAAILVDPYKVEEIADGIAMVLEDKKMTMELQERGWAQAKKFSWQKTAEETLKVYHEVAAK